MKPCVIPDVRIRWRGVHRSVAVVEATAHVVAAASVVLDGAVKQGRRPW